MCIYAEILRATKNFFFTFSKACLDFSLMDVMNNKQSNLNHYQGNPLPFKVLNNIHSLKTHLANYD